MRVALLGSGKTGSYVAKLHQECVIFNQSNKPDISKLQSCDVVISFLPGDVFSEYIPLLLESKKPVITGSTGFSWPQNLDQNLRENKQTWIRGNNFSLGMNIVKAMIQKLSLASHLYPEASFEIEETHHTKKLDAPSGTALSFEKWLGQKANIISHRTGDVIGDHSLQMDSLYESITLTHHAKDRALFANGALWAAKTIFKSQSDFGLIDFDNFVTKNIGI